MSDVVVTKKMKVGGTAFSVVTAIGKNSHITAVHEKERPHKCEQCDKAFYGSSDLKKHIIAVHDKLTPYKCARCEKEFGQLSNLTTHNATVHDKLTPYKCDHCNKVFGGSGDLRKHIAAVHNKLKPYKCNQCDKAFTQQGSINLHIAAVHDKLTPYKCDQCEKAFTQRGALKNHMSAVHDKLTPHKCNQCEKAFAGSGQLKKHIIAVHDKTHPHKCDQCNKEFSDLGHRNKHIARVHDKLRPHKCERCNAAFSASGDLKKHIDAVHLQIRAYMCRIPGCQKKFCYTISRDAHEKWHDKANAEAYLHKKEEWVVGFCKRHGYQFDREIHITYKGCGEDDTWARLDFVLYKDDHVLILSVDEFQHADREVLCEVARMSKVVCSIRQAGDMRRILWLRFNPDTVHHDGKTVRTPMERREARLKECIDTSGELLGDSEVAVYYLFYDIVTEGFDEPVVQVTLDQDYSPQWRTIVKGCFV